MTTQMMISRDFHGAVIHQRSNDGYLDATAMCKATNKRLNDYCRLKSTQEYIVALSSDAGIPASNIIQVVKGVQRGKTAQDQGTWIHPNASIHLAIWCSPNFAVMVTKWVFELLTKGSVSLKSEPNQAMAECAKINSDLLESFGITGNAKQTALNNILKEKFGYDALEKWNVEDELAETQSLNPTAIAKRTSLKSARQVNLKLIELKLQTAYRDSKKCLHYKLTEAGLKHGTYQDKSYNSSGPIRSIKWYESVLALF